MLMCKFEKKGFDNETALYTYKCVNCLSEIESRIDDSFKIHAKCISKPKDFKSLVKRYAQERKEWVSKNKPLRNAAEIIKIFDNHCSPCPHFKPSKKESVGSCTICGCSLRRDTVNWNKLAWGTTRCPDEPPKWVEATEDELMEKVDAKEELSKAKKDCCGRKNAGLPQ